MPILYIGNIFLRQIFTKRWLQLSAKQIPGQVVKRPPVVTIMGHVDHGKTTLLDYLRNSQIVKQEFGGITQHIGAFVVPFKQKDHTELVTFLDTPGHAAFHSMRQRGANITDIVVLVVACEDGVMEQTIESIKYAKAGKVPIIVAINKIDKYSDTTELEKNIDLLKKQLVVHDIITEDQGGDVQVVKISALQGIGVEDLKEAILALSETLELKAELDCQVTGRIIESQIHPHRGKLCTILVQKGQLNKGNILIAGAYNWAKVRALFDERAKLQQSCGPGLPIQVTGWREDTLPAAGDSIVQMNSEAEAKAMVNKFKQEQAKRKAMEDAKAAAVKAEEFNKFYQEKLVEKQLSGFKYRSIQYNPRGARPKKILDDSNSRKVNLVLKCDVDGSLEAILDLLDTYDRDNKQAVKLDVMHYGVGAINDNDYLMASSFNNSVIYGFNVKFENQKILVKAKHEGVNIKLFNVIYHLIDDLKARIVEQIPELEKEIEMAKADVIQEFVIDESKKKKTHVAGCRCSQGTLKRDLLYKLVRNRELIIQDMEVKSLKHLKDEVKEIEKGREFGISFVGHENLEFKPGDMLVGYEKQKYKPKLKWDLKGFS